MLSTALQMNADSHPSSVGLEAVRPNCIELRSGDLFESGAQTITVTVNCVGVMGKGIALEAKQRYPDVFKEYAGLCANGRMRMGEPIYLSRLIGPSFLLFPTKDHWRSVSKLSDIERGLAYLREHTTQWRIRSLAVPPLGCGNGGLEWAVVGPALYRGLSELDIPVFLYVPSGIPPTQEAMGLGKEVAGPADIDRAQRTSPPEVVAIVLALDHAVRANSRKRIGRVLIQKLAYFAMAAGVPARLRFEKKTYGPYSVDWMNQIRHLVNNGLLAEYRSQDREGFWYVPGPSLAAYAERLRGQVARYRTAIERTGLLISRLTPEQAELAATTHMVATQTMRPGSECITDQLIIEGVHQWKQRRKEPFTEERITQFMYCPEISINYPLFGFLRRTCQFLAV
jgi:uncharacterized protein YwgA/O-acetyl-ADP-ribose deacetylase (regulator of RNase III)